jgi:hypothetical protein
VLHLAKEGGGANSLSLTSIDSSFLLTMSLEMIQMGSGLVLL